MGYSGTNYEITVELTEHLLEEFERLHLKSNGFVLPGKQYTIYYLLIKYLKHPAAY